MEAKNHAPGLSEAIVEKIEEDEANKEYDKRWFVEKFWLMK